MRCPPKKFPRLEKLTNRRRAPARKQTPEEMKTIVTMLNALYGGSVAARKKD